MSNINKIEIKNPAGGSRELRRTLCLTKKISKKTKKSSTFLKTSMEV